MLENELMDMARFVGQEVHMYSISPTGVSPHLVEVKEKTPAEKREEAERRAIATASVVTLDESLNIKTGEHDNNMDYEESTD